MEDVGVLHEMGVSNVGPYLSGLSSSTFGLNILSCVYPHPWWYDSYGLTWERMQRWKITWCQKRKKESTWEVEALSLYFGLTVLHMNSLPSQTNNILLIIWGQTTNKEMLKFLDFLGSTLSLKQTWDKASRQDISKDKGLGQSVTQICPQFWECPQTWKRPYWLAH